MGVPLSKYPSGAEGGWIGADSDSESESGEWCTYPEVLSPAWATFHRLIKWPGLLRRLDAAQKAAAEAPKDAPDWKARQSVDALADFAAAYEEDDFRLRAEVGRLQKRFWLSDSARLCDATTAELGNGRLAEAVLSALEAVEATYVKGGASAEALVRLGNHKACTVCGYWEQCESWTQHVVWVDAGGQRSLVDAIRRMPPTFAAFTPPDLPLTPCTACKAGKEKTIGPVVQKLGDVLLIGPTHTDARSGAHVFPEKPLCFPQSLNPLRDGWLWTHLGETDFEWDLVGVEGETVDGDFFTVDGRGDGGVHLLLSAYDPIQLSPDEFDIFCDYPTEAIFDPEAEDPPTVQINLLWYKKTKRQGKDGLVLKTPLSGAYVLTPRPLNSASLGMTGGIFGARLKGQPGPHFDCVVKTLDANRQESWREVELLWEQRGSGVVAELKDVFYTTVNPTLRLVFARYRADLGRTIREAAPLPFKKATGLLSACAAGVGYLHARFIFHADLKEANFFVSFGGGVRVGDLGLSRQLQSDRHVVPAHGHTVGYGSPEHLKCDDGEGGGVGLPADIWALGIMLFIALSGRRPVGSEVDAERDLVKRATLPFHLLTERRSQTLLRQILTADPLARPDIDEFGALLGGR